jgi:hypothetical protein
MSLHKAITLFKIFLLIMLLSCSEDDNTEIVVDDTPNPVNPVDPQDPQDPQPTSCYGLDGSIKVLSTVTIRPDLTGSLVDNISIGVDGNDHIAITYYESNGAHVWLDQDGDGAFDDGETQSFGTDSHAGTPSAMTISNGKIAVGYRDSDGTLKLWLDTNGNGIEESSEIQVIDGQANIFDRLAIACDSRGRLAILYYDQNVKIFSKLWVDENNNGIADDGEIRNNKHSGWDGFSTITAFFDSNDHINLTSANPLNWEVWVDHNNNYTIDTGENLTIAGPDPDNQNDPIGAECTLAENANGHLAAASRDRWAVNLWVDGNDNKMGDPGEFNPIGSVWPSHEIKLGMTADCHGNLAIAYNNQNPQLILWLDKNGNNAADEGESIVVDETSSSNTDRGLHPAIAVGPDHNLIIAYSTISPSTLRLSTVTVE